MRVPDEVRQCVVFVGLGDGKGGVSFKGTAFFVSVPSKSKPEVSYLYLVTAKHVAALLQDKPFLIRANTNDGKSCVIGGARVHWWYHPTDPFVDVAIISWVHPENMPLDYLEYKHIPTTMFLSDEAIYSRAIGTGDEVFITGLFAHLTGSSRNLPIVRIGNIAMFPTEPVPTRIGNIEAYLIEARSIGGLSGSPAFVIQTAPPEVGKLYLLGLMHGHWDIPPEAKNDQLVMDNDHYKQVNMGIAIVIPAKKILEVMNQEILDTWRRLEDQKMQKEQVPPPM